MAGLSWRRRVGHGSAPPTAGAWLLRPLLVDAGGARRVPGSPAPRDRAPSSASARRSRAGRPRRGPGCAPRWPASTGGGRHHIAALREGDGPTDAFRLDDVAGVAVAVHRAEGRKCARSWKILPTVGSDPAFPDVSPRDAKALREWEAVRSKARA